MNWTHLTHDVRVGRLSQVRYDPLSTDPHEDGPAHVGSCSNGKEESEDSSGRGDGERQRRRLGVGEQVDDAPNREGYRQGYGGGYKQLRTA